MKKFMIIWFTLVFIAGCSLEQELKPSNKKDVLDNAVVIADETTVKKEIQSNLNYFLHKHNRHWSWINKKLFVEIVYAGQVEFGISSKIVMAIISVESQYNIRAQGRNRNSIDYGLTQQNSKYINRRYAYAEKRLKALGFKYSSSIYDISKNVFACYAYLYDMSDIPELLYFRDYIDAYNKGVHGALKNKTDNLYYQKFMTEYMEIL